MTVTASLSGLKRDCPLSSSEPKGKGRFSGPPNGREADRERPPGNPDE